jgi:hypothetical protein
MGLLSAAEISHYALTTGKIFQAVCDAKNCGKLILATELFTVVTSDSRTDGLVFLGAIPTKIRCNACQRAKYPIPIIKKKMLSKMAKAISKAILRLYEKNPKTVLDTKTLISKFKRKAKFSKVKRKEFTVALRSLKKDKMLVYSDKLWKAPKKSKAK